MSFLDFQNQHGIDRSNTHAETPKAKANKETVPAVVQKLCNDVADRLKAAKAKYIIILADGSVLESGDLRLAKPERYRKPRLHPYGTFSRIHGDKLKGMDVSDVVTFAPHEYLPLGVTAEHLKNTLTSAMFKLYGHQSWETDITDKGVVEVIRIR